MDGTDGAYQVPPIQGPNQQQFEAIMNQLMQTANAAIQASESANAMASLVQSSTSSSTTGSLEGSTKDLYKLIQKPALFSPENREQEISQWRDWFWALRQYLAVVNGKFQEDTNLILKDLDKPIDFDVLDLDKQSRSQFLYSFLSSLIKGRALTILKNIGDCNGLEVLRNLIQTFQPSSKSRSLAIMNSIMAWKEFDMKQALFPQILKLEEAFQELARVSDPLPETIKLAVLTRCITGQLKTCINIHLDEGSSFDQLREAVLRFDRANTRWTPSSVLGQDVVKDEVVAMEVDRIKGGKKGKYDVKGKGKDARGKDGKGKGFGSYQNFQNYKGKGKSHGDFKGKGRDGKGKHEGKFGKGKFEKGKEKGKSKDSGKDGKGKGQGWNSGTWNQYGNSNWNWNYNRVRQVDETHADSSQVSTTSPSASVSQVAGSETNKTVRLITEPNASSPVVFDFTGGSSSYGDGYVRTISEVVDVQSDEDEENHGRHAHGCYSTCLAAKGLDESHGFCSCSYYDISDETFCEQPPDELDVFELRESEHVRMVHIQDMDDRNMVEIVIDSGSDASLIPFSMDDAGEKVSGDSCSILYDAQGNVMEASGERKIEVALQGEDDTSNSIPILFREQVHVGPVGNPILCYGRLFENYWEIVKSNGEPFLRHSSGVQVPIHMRGRSLFIHGEIRKIEKVVSDAHAIRAIKITRPSALAELPSGWHWWNGFRVCHTMQKKCVDPRDDEHGSQTAYRTIMMKYDDCWRILEMSEDWRRMHDNDLLQAISPKYRECLTVMSANPVATSDLEVELMLHTATAASSQESSDRHVPPGQQEHVVGEHHEHESAFEFPREEAVAPELLVASDSADVGEHVALLPDRMEEYTEDGSFTIEGVTVTADSATRVLRAACKALGISQSGRQVKLFSKIQAYFDQKRIELTKEAAMKAKTMNERIPSTSPLAELPSNQDEIEKHMLTHLPFQPWCAACVMARGRQDQHRSDETRRGDREIPTVSVDFCYTGYSDNSAGGQEETEESEKDKLCCLVLHDSGTNDVHAVPVDEKKNLHFLTGEVVRFISWLGHGGCILRSDQEPVLLRLQTLVQDARLKAGLKTTKENPAVKSHASNSLVENSIQRIRNMSNTILHSLREKTALKFGCQQALTSWSWHHAAWLINHYAPNHGQTGYELLTGHGYRGKVAMFGEPVWAYTFVDGMPKGDARWTRGLFLGKTALNDMYIIGLPGKLQLTRSVRRNMHDWTDATDLYAKFNVTPWKVAGTMGVKLIPDLKKDEAREPYGLSLMIEPQGGSKTGTPIEGSKTGPGAFRGSKTGTPIEGSKTGTFLDDVVSNDGSQYTPDEAASDPPSPDEVPSMPLHVSDVGQPEQQGKEQAGPMASVESPTAVRESKRPIESDVSREAKVSKTTPSTSAEVRSRDEALGSEDVPAQKKPREESRKSLRTHRIATHPQDCDDFEGWNFEDEIFSTDFSLYEWEEHDPKEIHEEDLIFRCKFDDESEPQLAPDELRKLDERADQLEVARLIAMGVLRTNDSLSEKEVEEVQMRNDNLTAKYVRTWRSKVDSQGRYWLRRARLVAREYQFLEERFDVFSPASSSAIVRLLPALMVTKELPDNWCLCGFDIGDAFLMAPQPYLRNVRIVETNQQYIISRCLPGQRDAAKIWYNYFTGYLKEFHKLEACVECPALLRGDHCMMLIHVDDVLMVCDPFWLKQQFLPDLQKRFRVSHQVAEKVGESVDFLKRKYSLTEYGIVVTPSARHVEDIIEKFEKYNNGRKARLAKSPNFPALFQEQKDVKELDDKKSSQFKSLVGSLLYVSHDRWDIAFAVKSLASFLKRPTVVAWSALAKIVGYLKVSPTVSLLLRESVPGSNVFENMCDINMNRNKQENCEETRRNTRLEVHTDSDWQGSFQVTKGKSTSRAIHYVNGCAIHFTSRSQKVVSLSSTESEWYAACSGVSDGLFLKYCCEFLARHVCDLALRLDNNGARFLAFKTGNGRIKHMKGKYLWIQALVEDGSLEIGKVSTVMNTSDLGTKGLARNRMLALMCIIGFVDGEENSIGEHEYQSMVMEENNKQRVRQICKGIALAGSEESTRSRTPLMNTSSVQLAKRILAITIMSSILSVGNGISVTSVFTEDEGDIDCKIIMEYIKGLFIVFVYGICICFCYFMIVLVIYKVLLNENGLNEMIFRLRYMFDMKYVKYIAVACISFKVSSGLGLAVQMVGKHVEKGGTQEHDEGTDVGTLLFLLKVCMVIMCISSVFVSFCAWKMQRARLDIDDVYDVLHGMVHDTNEIRRSVERMEQTYEILANQRMNTVDLRLCMFKKHLVESKVV